MLQLWRSFMDDQTFAIRAVRAVLAGLGVYLTATGKIDPTVGSLLTGGGLFLGAGEKNPVPPTPPTK